MPKPKKLKAEIFFRKKEIDSLIRSGFLITASSIRSWLINQGVKADSRVHFNEVLKSVFPEYVINKRWDPIDSLIKESIESSAIPLEAPVSVKIDPRDEQYEVTKKEQSEDSEVVRCLDDGIELDREVYKYVEEYMVKSASDTILRAMILQTVRGRRYMDRQAEKSKSKNF